MNQESQTEPDQTSKSSNSFSEANIYAELTNDALNAPEAGVETGPERGKVFEQARFERGGILRDALTSTVVSNGLDLVPFVGGGKMLAESIAGNTLDGEELNGKSRIIHAAMGAGSLTLDLTGVGEVREGALLAGKSVNMIGKLASELTEKGAIKAGRLFEISARFMAAHPELTASAEQGAESQIRAQIQNIKAYRKHEPHQTNTEAA